MPAAPKNKAKISILSELLSFPTVRGMDWTRSFGAIVPQAGDLVAMSSAPPSKWYLSWLHEYQPNNGWPKYLLESIEDGALCWWGNIGVDIYNRERVRDNPQWRWNDQQFTFASRWYRACNRIEGWEVRACRPKFNDDGSVELNVRIHIALESIFTNPRIFPNWKKVTIKEMESYYSECTTLYKKYKKEEFAQRKVNENEIASS